MVHRTVNNVNKISLTTCTGLIVLHQLISTTKTTEAFSTTPRTNSILNRASHQHEHEHEIRIRLNHRLPRRNYSPLYALTSPDTESTDEWSNKSNLELDLDVSSLTLPRNEDASNVVIESIILEGAALQENSDIFQTPVLASNALTSTTTDDDSPSGYEDNIEVNESEEGEDNAGGVRNILRFAIPAIGVWLCGPLLSCIDTAAVGLLSGTMNQAALSPAVAITDYSVLLLSFIYTATTNLMAGSNDKNSQNSASDTLINAMRISAYCGAMLSAMLLLSSKALVDTMIGGGTDAVSTMMGTTALRYVRIRALGMPAAAVIGCAQAACLGLKDIRAPFYVLAAAAIVNFCGDVLFVGHPSKLIGGAAGAAWATVLSQYVALGFFMKWLLHQLPSSKKDDSNTSLGGINDCNSNRNKLEETLISPVAQNNVIATKSALRRTLRRKKKAPTDSKKASFSVKGFLAGKFEARDMLRVPSKEVMQKFAPYVLPVTASSVGRVSMFIAMNYIVSSTLGTTAMAAQQIILSIFYCLCPIADSLSLTAQSLVPSIHSQPVSKTRLSKLKDLIQDLMKTGALFGTLMCALVSCIPLISNLFTTDTAVIDSVHSALPHLMAIFGLHGLVQAGEGMLLGSKDLKFLGNAFSAFFAIVPYGMIYKKRVAGPALSLTGLWEVFVSYQCVRCVLWWSRIWILHRRSHKQQQIQHASVPILRVLDDVGNSMNEVEGVMATSTAPPDELIVSPNLQ